MDILATRLSNQFLTSEKLLKPADVVKNLGALQAQDYAAAKWSLGLRLKNATNETVELALDRGEILRTHVMRPTWHFVVPQDIRWMLELTSPRIKTLMNHYNRKIELDDEVFKKCNSIIEKALGGGKHLTRSEIAEQLEANKIPARGQRLGHIVANAELDAVICNGPRRGKQFTYALLEERTAKTKKIDRNEALAKLALTYLKGHGPALVKDFAWWSGLSAKDANEGLSMNKSKLNSIELDGKTYWHSGNDKTNASQNAFLMSVYDEYFIGYTDRKLILEDHHKANMAAVGNALLTSLVIINGKVEGTWKRKIEKNKIKMKLNLFRKLNTNETEMLQKEAEKYGKFFSMPVEF